MSVRGTSALFHEAPLRAVFEHQEKEMLRALAAMPASEFRNKGVDEVAADLVEQFRIDPIELTEAAVSVAAEEAKVDVSGSWDRDIPDRSRPYHVQGIRVSYFVPFTGDRELFRFQPSTFSFHLPRAVVGTNELAFHFDRADTEVPATKRGFDEELRHLKEWLAWTNRDVEAFNASLSAKVAQAVAERSHRLTHASEGLGSLGIPIRSASTPTAPRPRGKRAPRQPKAELYDVALSFAGEDRQYVEQVAVRLRELGVNVFYDAFEKATLWGKNMVDHLADIYQHRSRFVVMFVSQHYAAKAWPQHERQHAQARALVAQGEYILPARFDDTEVPGMTTTVAYVDLRTTSPTELAELIKTKIG